MSRQFGAGDWIVFVAVLSISAFIGIFYALQSSFGVNKNTTAEFLMGGRQLRLLPVSISILVSYMSAILILGTPAEMYTAGTLYLWYMFGISLACILAATIIVPLLYPLKLTSSFEYIEQRFDSKAAKLTGALIMMVKQILYMGIASYAPSTALEAVTGFPTWATIITIGGVSTFYTVLGGMKAVVWTDVFQAAVMFAGLITIVILSFVEVGGPVEVWRINKDWDRLHFWEGDPDPTLRHSVWSLVFGGAIAWFGLFGVSQPSVQRYCAVPTLHRAKWAVLINIAGVAILMSLTALTGIIMFAYYAKEGCDPMSVDAVDNANQLLPYFIVKVLGYPGLPGLFVSCLFSGALSTMSSCLNALAAVGWEDMIKPLVGNKVSESTKSWITRLLVVFFGAAGVGVAFLAKNLGGTVLQASLSFVGAAAGPLLGIFLLGGLFPCANAAGCVVGGLSGLTLAMWISIGSYSLPGRHYSLPFPTSNCTLENVDMYNGTTTIATDISTTYQLSGIEHIYTISYLWFPTIGSVITIVVGLVVSFITAPFLPTRQVDPKYLIPIFDRLFGWLPESWRRKCRCGYIFQTPEDLVLFGDMQIQQKNEKREHVWTKSDIVHSNEAFNDDVNDKTDKDPLDMETVS